MCEPIRGADDERIEGVAAVEAGSAGNGRVSCVWTFGEVVGPTLFRTAGGFTVFVGFIGVDGGVVGLGGGFRLGGITVVGALGGRGDASPQLDLLSESATERVGDRGTQMAFDLVLDEAARHG